MHYTAEIPTVNELANSQIRSDSQTLADDVGKLSGFELCKVSRLSFSTWLHSLEAGERLLLFEAKTPQNVSWCKGVLRRWREAGYPDPEQWPETRSAECLRPSYSLNHAEWPNPLA